MLAKLPAHRMNLLAAADLIEMRGHCKGQRADSRGRLCVLGALEKTGQGLRGLIGTNEYFLLRSYLHENELIPNNSASVPAWNDAPERTQAEVVAALRAAATWGL